MDYDIIHNESESRFETSVDGLLSVVDYVRRGDTLFVTHSGVPKELEGRGIAAALTKSLLQYVRDNQLRVRPVCPYTVSYIARHPEYSDLVD